MKRLFKSISFLIIAILMSEILNKLIIERSKFYIKNRITRKLIYKWKYGKIYYSVEGKGKPILMIHGLYIGASSLEWDENVRVFSKDYKVYSLDLLGFGLSDKPNISYSGYLYTSLINDFIKYVIKEKTIVIANALAADHTVMAYNFNSNNFDKLVLISPKCLNNVKYPNSKDFITNRILRLPVIGDIIYNLCASKIYMQWFLKNKYFNKSFKINKKLVNDYYCMAHYTNKASKHSVSNLVTNIINVNTKDSILNITIPVLIIWGKYNSLNPLENYYSIRSDLNEHSVHIFQDSKTMPHLEESNNFNYVVHTFLKDNLIYLNK